MRRMIDPKELGGGGGGSGVYMYAVKITGKSLKPATLIFNVITNHTGLLTKEAVGRSETFTEEKDRHSFFSKLKEIWPSDSYDGDYILATGTFGNDTKDVNYIRYNQSANVITMYKDEADGNNQDIGEGSTNRIMVQRIM